ncbi:hypothetical protein RSSE_p1377 (plasmid) [Ralstonia solanacearum]|nr:hypothetical protein RSSE_p1377 [Ralstonia solanacearum]
MRPPARLRWRCRQKRARPTGRWARNNSLTERRQRAEGRYAGCGAWGGGRVASRAVSAASAITKQPVMWPASGAWWTWSPIARRIVPGDTTCMLPSRGLAGVRVCCACRRLGMRIGARRTFHAGIVSVRSPASCNGACGDPCSRV